MGISHQEQRVKSPKVSLYLRVRNADGQSVYAKAFWNKNHTLRSGYAESDSRHHPEGVYYLRFLQNGKRVWKSVGREPDAALTALQRTDMIFVRLPSIFP